MRLDFGAAVVAGLVIVAGCGGGGGKSQDNGAVDTVAVSGEMSWDVEELAPLCVADTQGVAGAVAFLSDGRLCVAGGANFPGKPAAEGGKKKVYGEVYMLDGGQWGKLEGGLARPLAYAAVAYGASGAGVLASGASEASASRAGGLASGSSEVSASGAGALASGASEASASGASVVYVLGGNDGNGSVRDAFVIRGVKEGRLVVESLPELPVATENGAAACVGGCLYLICGQTSEGASNAVWRLRLAAAADSDSGEPAAQWERVADVPGPGRVQCSAAALGGNIYLAGGYNPGDGTVNASLFVYLPESDEWRFVDSLRKPEEMMTSTLVGGSLLADEEAGKLLMVGGVDATIFQEAISRPMKMALARETGDTAFARRLEREAAEYMHHEASWYRFSGEMTSFSVRGQEFAGEVSHPSLARAGAAVVMSDGVIYVVNGELKPGIRANTAVALRRVRR